MVDFNLFCRDNSSPVICYFEEKEMKSHNSSNRGLRQTIENEENENK